MSWLPVAKKEYLENVRNAWVIAVSVVFLVLTLLTSAFTSASETPGGIGFAKIGPTLNLIDTVGGFLLPILALMLGFGTLAGERESGSLGLLLAQPLRRSDVLVGKWIGLFGVLATAILAGFGLGGLFVVMRTGASPADMATLLTFLVEALAWGAAWISITVFLSAWFNRRGTAIAGSIGAWFFFSTLIWELLVFVVIVGTLGAASRNTPRLPDWLIVTQWLNPNTAYEGLASTTITGFGEVTRAIGGATMPDMWKGTYFGIALALWIVIPFAGAWAIFQKKDV